MAKFAELLGKTIVEITGAEKGSETITIQTSDGKRYDMYHEQDCCESVRVEDVIGDVKDLLNSPITLADEAVNPPDSAALSHLEMDDSNTWTFYRLATVNGYVTIRWLGSSNGYYSERVSFGVFKKE